jgi:multiple sugar transport system permease protein
VTLPALRRPVITVLFILAALRGLRTFTEVFLLAAALLALLPSVAAFLAFQRQFASGFTHHSFDR